MANQKKIKEIGEVWDILAEHAFKVEASKFLGCSFIEFNGFIIKWIKSGDNRGFQKNAKGNNHVMYA